MAAVAICQHYSQSALLLLKLSPGSPTKPSVSTIRSSSSHLLTSAATIRLPSLPSPLHKRQGARCVTSVADQEGALLAVTDDPPFEVVRIVEDVKVEDIGVGFGGDVGGGEDGSGSGGGGGGDGVGGGKGEGEGESGEEKKMSGMSMSQKLTLGYAALVGVGGIMGYMKSGSRKSLAAGGGSALLLYFVYAQLPVRPAFASSLGLGLSAALLTVMGSRFKRSGKIFPAGVVSVVSFIMAGGYLHGILRSLHAES